MAFNLSLFSEEGIILASTRQAQQEAEKNE